MGAVVVTFGRLIRDDAEGYAVTGIRSLMGMLEGVWKGVVGIIIRIGAHG